jgi:murein DD-endopeptidase MepM/ murein hydrolase activator NlpD
MDRIIRRKYYLNPETLRYERVTFNSKQRVRFWIIAGTGLILVAALLRFGFERHYPTPRQLLYERENAMLRSEYVALDRELQEVESELAELRNRDDRFYRAILSLEPVSSSIRNAGTGGAQRDLHLSSVRNRGMIMDVSQKIEKISNRVQIQSTSLESVYEEAISNQHFLACKPSINPISSADPYWQTSSYGYRIDPFTHKRAPHFGIDLAGPHGLDVHCTGEGTVKHTGFSRYGYGNEVVVDHGFGYVTRYAHLQDILVEKGQKLKRGQVLGTLGSSGRSTGPHLHYEVQKDGRTVNPMYFFYENLTPVEYTQLASRANLPDSMPDSMPEPMAMSQK